MTHVNDRVINGVGIIELNRPERRHALSDEMFERIPMLVEQYDADDAIKCILVTATGTAFCAGGDLRDKSVYSLDEMTRCILALYRSPKVSIAALPGAAAGAGMALALVCDLRIAAASAKLVPAWGAVGFSGDYGGIYFLTQLIGPGRTLAALIDNATFSSAECERLGVFNRVVADDALAADAIAWAAGIASGPQTAYRSMKRNVRDALTLDFDTYLPVESQRMIASGQTKDHRDAVRRWQAAAQAKRDP